MTWATLELDMHRALRQGCPEVVFCQGKTAEQVAAILDGCGRGMIACSARASPDQAAFARRPAA